MAYLINNVIQGFVDHPSEDGNSSKFHEKYSIHNADHKNSEAQNTR